MLHICVEPRGDGLRMCHCICQRLSNEGLRQQFRSYYREEERPNRHIKCRPLRDDLEMQWLDLRALRTCQQIYHEAVAALWTTNTFSFDDSSPFLEFLQDKTVEQRQMIRHVRFDISHLDALDWWLRDAQNLLVAIAKENTVHITLSVMKKDARHWPHPGACVLASHVLSADPLLFLCTALFNIEVENKFGGVSVITGMSLVHHLLDLTLTKISRGDQETDHIEEIDRVGMRYHSPNSSIGSCQQIVLNVQCLLTPLTVA